MPPFGNTNNFVFTPLRYPSENLPTTATRAATPPQRTYATTSKQYATVYNANNIPTDPVFSFVPQPAIEEITVSTTTGSKEYNDNYNILVRNYHFDEEEYNRANTANIRIGVDNPEEVRTQNNDDDFEYYGDEDEDTPRRPPSRPTLACELASNKASRCFIFPNIPEKPFAMKGLSVEAPYIDGMFLGIDPELENLMLILDEFDYNDDEDDDDFSRDQSSIDNARYEIMCKKLLTQKNLDRYNGCFGVTKVEDLEKPENAELKRSIVLTMYNDIIEEYKNRRITYHNKAKEKDSNDNRADALRREEYINRENAQKRYDAQFVNPFSANCAFKEPQSFEFFLQDEYMTPKVFPNTRTVKTDNGTYVIQYNEKGHTLGVVVQYGETIQNLAEKFNVSDADIIAANQYIPRDPKAPMSSFMPGETIVIPKTIKADDFVRMNQGRKTADECRQEYQDKQRPGYVIASAMYKEIHNHSAAPSNANFKNALAKVNENNVIETLTAYQTISPNESLIEAIMDEVGSSLSDRKAAIDTIIKALKARAAKLQLDSQDERLNKILKDAESELNSYYSIGIGYCWTKKLEVYILNYSGAIEALEKLLPEDRTAPITEDDIIRTRRVIKSHAASNFRKIDQQNDADGWCARTYNRYKDWLYTAHNACPESRKYVSDKIYKFLDAMDELEKAYNSGGIEALKQKFEEIFEIPYNVEAIRAYERLQQVYIDASQLAIVIDGYQKEFGACLDDNKDFDLNEMEGRFGAYLAAQAKTDDTTFSPQLAVRAAINSVLKEYGLNYDTTTEKQKKDALRIAVKNIHKAYNKELSTITNGRELGEIKHMLDRAGASAFGSKMDINALTDAYVESQTIGSAIVNNTLKIAATIAICALTAGTGLVGLAALAVAGAGTMVSSAAIDISDRLSSNVGLTDEQMNQFLINAAIDGACVVIGGASVKAIEAFKSPSAFKAASGIISDVAIGAGAEYLQTGEITIEGVVIQVVFSASGHVLALSTKGKKEPQVSNKEHTVQDGQPATQEPIKDSQHTTQGADAATTQAHNNGKVSGPDTVTRVYKPTRTEESLHPAIREARNAQKGRIRTTAELNSKTVADSMNAMMDVITPTEIDGIISSLGSNQKLARRTMARMGQYADIAGFDGVIEYFAKKPNMKIIASNENPSINGNIEYFAQKSQSLKGQVCRAQTTLEGLKKAIGTNKKGKAALILDEPTLREIENNAELRNFILEHKKNITLILPDGLNSGVTIFNTASKADIEAKGRQIYAEAEKRMAANPKLTIDEAIDEVLNGETINRVNQLFNGEIKVTTIKSNTIKDSSSENIARLYSSKEVTPENIEEIISDYKITKGDPQIIREILGQNSRCYSMRSLCRLAKEQHSAITTAATERNINPQNIYYLIPSEKSGQTKSYGVVAAIYRETNNIPADHFVTDISKLPANAEMVVVLDDFAGSGNSLKEVFEGITSTPKEPLPYNKEGKTFNGYVAIAPLLATEGEHSATALFSRINSDKLIFCPSETTPMFRKSEWYQSLPIDQARQVDEIMGMGIVAVAGTKTEQKFGFATVDRTLFTDPDKLIESYLDHAACTCTSLPYMAPNNNNAFFATYAAKYFTHYKKGIKNQFPQPQPQPHPQPQDSPQPQAWAPVTSPISSNFFATPQSLCFVC